MSIAAIGSYGNSAWNVQTPSVGSSGTTQQSTQSSTQISVPVSTETTRLGTVQGGDEYVPSQATADETAATYKPPGSENMPAAGPMTRNMEMSAGPTEGPIAIATNTESEPTEQTETETDADTSISVGTTEESLNAAPAAAPMTSVPVETETEEESSSTDTIGKPSWISDDNWTAIQENPNQQPSDMSDDDWQAYLEWSGKSAPERSSESGAARENAALEQPVQSEQSDVTEGMPPSAASTTVTEEQAATTTRETTTQSAVESGNRFNEYANRYSRWNSGNMNVGNENQINITV